MGDTASPCMTIRGGWSGSEHSPCSNVSGTPPAPEPGVCSGHTLALQESPAHRTFESVRERWWGSGGCSVSPKFEFLCFSWLVLILNLKKGIFCLEQTCGGKRTFVQKEMFLASVCYVSFTLLRTRVCECSIFVCLFSLWLSFPFCLFL